jgi:hypothetical protein
VGLSADRHCGGRRVHASPAGFLGHWQGGRQQVLEWDDTGVMRALEWGRKSQGERWDTVQGELHWNSNGPARRARISGLSIGAGAPGTQSHGQWWQGFKGGRTGLTRNTRTTNMQVTEVGSEASGVSQLLLVMPTAAELLARKVAAANLAKQQVTAAA